MRGQIQNSTVSWILFIIVIVVLGLIVGNLWNPLFIKPLEENNCAAQIQAHQTISSASKGKVAPPFSCPTREVNITSEMVDEEVLYRVAEEIRWCWDTWGKGKYELFKEEGTYCHICSIVSFEEERQVPGLYNYLYTTDVEPDITYLDYFNPEYSGDKFTEVEFIKKLDDKGIIGRGKIDGSTNHAVIFYYVRGKKEIDALFTSFDKNKAEAIGIGTGTGLVIGTGVAGVTVVLCTIATFGWCGLTTGVILGVTAGVASGAGSGMMAWIFGSDPPQSYTSVMFRPLTMGQIKDIRCERSFANR